jgi:CheY-like chemotaxis protein
MSQSGPIIIIEDDHDDQEILSDACSDLGIPNKLIFFDTTDPAFQYLLTTEDKPLIIISDINIPVQGGLEFKRKIDNDPYLRQKSIPFVFLTTFIDRRAVDVAYKELTIQGFFKKNERYEELKKQLLLIIDYWKLCRHPNSE